MSKTVTLGPFGFSGGYNPSATAFNLPPDHLLSLTGAEVRYGAVVNKPGNMSLVAGGGPITSQISSYAAMPFGAFLVVVTSLSAGASPKFFSSTSLSTTFSDITGTAPVANVLSTYGVLNSLLIYSHSSISAIKWPGSGTTAALGGTPPANAAAIRVVNNFLFFAVGSTVYWSAVGDPETYPAANNVIFRKGDGDTIKALGVIGTDLLIFKSSSIGRLSTVTNTASGSAALGPLTTVSDKIGISGPLSVDNLTDGSCVFLAANQHLFRYDGSIIQDLSDRPYPSPNVQALLDTVKVGGTNTYAQVRVDNSTNQVWILFNVSGSSAESPDTALIYDANKDYWVLGNHAGASFCNYVSALTVGAYKNTLFVSTVNGNVYGEGNGFYYWGNTSVTHEFSISFNFGPDSRNFEPRSILIPYSSDVDNTCTVTVGWDGVYGSPVTMPITSATLSRFIMPVDTWSPGHHTMQIKIRPTIEVSGGNYAFYPIYVSGEVLA